MLQYFEFEQEVSKTTTAACKSLLPYSDFADRTSDPELSG